MRHIVALACLSLLWSLPALADVYKCVDNDGRITYTNTKGSGANCSVLSKDVPVSTISAGALSRSGQTSGRSDSSASAGAGFPSVSGEVQKQRDSTREQILKRELETETADLEAARKKLTENKATRNGDEKNYQKYLDRVQSIQTEVDVHERNIRALNEELGRR